MRTLYFDCFAGASGDMIVSALIDLGVHIDDLRNFLNKITISDYQIDSPRINKNGISAQSFNVILSDHHEDKLADSEFSEINHMEDPNKHGLIEPSVRPHESRNYSEIKHLIQQSNYPDHIKLKILTIFENLAIAEAEVHDVRMENVHFHEVGGTDAIIDISCAVFSIEALNIEQIIISPLHLGSGFVKTSHGLLPVPAPATIKLIEGYPAYTSDVKGELLTPTGAAILTTLASGFGPLPLMKVHKVGYGAGKRDRDFPNVLRVYLGDTHEFISTRNKVNSISRDPFPEQHQQSMNELGFHEHPAMILEANIDDMNPQFYQPLLDSLLNAGALDVTLTHTLMKKNRPGVVLQVLSPHQLSNHLIELIFQNSTTIGIRSYPVTKHMLAREVVSIPTEFGNVDVKISWMNNQVINITPEYESCLRISRRMNLPIKKIHSAALISAQSIYESVGN